MAACPRISFTTNSVTHLVELADQNYTTKMPSSVTWLASTPLHSLGKHLLLIATDVVPLPLLPIKFITKMQNNIQLL